MKSTNTRVHISLTIATHLNVKSQTAHIDKNELELKMNETKWKTKKNQYHAFKLQKLWSTDRCAEFIFVTVCSLLFCLAIVFVCDVLVSCCGVVLSVWLTWTTVYFCFCSLFLSFDQTKRSMVKAMGLLRLFFLLTRTFAQ